MAIFVFVLALILAAGGAGGLLASLDLLPTEIGMLYALCGIMALSAACIVAAIGAVVVRMDRIGARVRSALAGDFVDVATGAEHVSPHHETTPPPRQQSPHDEAEHAINENRTGHLPTIEDLEEGIAHPEPAPLLVGRYSAGGANYMIFSDGAIEAETEEGQFRFASMGEFKDFMHDRKEARG